MRQAVPRPTCNWTGSYSGTNAVVPCSIIHE
jgi:hypothetical protein